MGTKSIFVGVGRVLKLLPEIDSKNCRIHRIASMQKTDPTIQRAGVSVIGLTGKHSVLISIVVLIRRQACFQSKSSSGSQLHEHTLRSGLVSMGSGDAARYLL